MQNRAVRHALTAAVLLAPCGAAIADDAVIQPEQAAAAAGWTLIEAPTHTGTTPFLVRSVREKTAAAMRDRSAEAPFNSGITPEPEAGYELHARVIVRTDDGAALGLLVGAMTANAAKVLPAGVPDRALPGFWLAECDSVEQAVALAGALRGDAAIREAYLDVREPIALRTDLPTDPDFISQWSLRNGVNPLFDANLEPAWKAGFTGAGITVAIVENGWYTLHPDLAAKYSADASQAGTAWQSHGVSVAGIVGMIANNDIGGAGAAYGAGLSKLYIGSASINAAAFMYRNDLNQVKNNSWGPVDNGVARILSSAERTALADAIATGRGGLGTIFVWAAGNGGTGVDRVDYDPYASCRHTIAVGAIDSQDRRSLYSEPGSSLLLVTQSDYDLASGSDLGIFSTTGSGSYTTGFGGTSAAAPLASGVVAVVLHANPNLTWRDVQQVLVRSARKCRPADASWQVNGAGLDVSEQFGFGAIDAGAAVALAQTWTTLGPEFMHDTGEILESLPIPDNDAAGLTRTVNVPVHMEIESVELVLTAAHASCGQLRVSITSPGGLESLLANTRTDNAATYGNGYIFTSMKHLGERAGGTWTLKVADGVNGTTGTLTSWRLRFHGTQVPCPCDWETDGDLDVPDIFAFLSGWFAGEGDFDLNGVNEVPDIFSFLTCWFAGGCP